MYIVYIKYSNMRTKIYQIKKILLYLVCLLFFLTGCNSKLDYTIETTLNPNNIAPLTAMLNITSEVPCQATIKVLGDIPVEQSFEESSTNLNIPVLGLYANKLNKVEVTLNYDGGKQVEIIEIQTSEVPNFFPEIGINKLDKEEMEPGMHALDIHFANFGKFRSASKQTKRKDRIDILFEYSKLINSKFLDLVVVVHLPPNLFLLRILFSRK